MSIVSNLIFNGQHHYITSPYGRRTVISTSSGKTASFHSGTDYGTDGKKLPQYAIEDGTILSCGTARDGAKFVWVKYPRINKKFLHYHLDSISVKKGQAVKKGTKLGTTGKTGKATGIHLHLGVKDLRTDKYENPETFAKTYKEPTKKNTNIEIKSQNIGGNDMTRGYFKVGDKNEGVYALKQLLIALKRAGVISQGVDDNNIFGDGTKIAVKQVQRAAGLTQDGCAGVKTIRACYALLAKKL